MARGAAPSGRRYPEPVVDVATAAREARDRIWQARKAAGFAGNRRRGSSRRHASRADPRFVNDRSPRRLRRQPTDAGPLTMPRGVKKVRPAAKDLRHLRQAVHLAQEMGKGLGRGALLLGPLPQPMQGALIPVKQRIAGTETQNLCSGNFDPSGRAVTLPR